MRTSFRFHGGQATTGSGECCAQVNENMEWDEMVVKKFFMKKQKGRPKRPRFPLATKLRPMQARKSTRCYPLHLDPPVKVLPTKSIISLNMKSNSVPNLEWKSQKRGDAGTGGRKEAVPGTVRKRTESCSRTSAKRPSL